MRASYLERPADQEFYDTLVAGQDVYLFAPMRSGKTSLIAAASARLRNNGFQVAVLDLAQIGERDAGSDAGRWFYSIAYRLLRQLRIKVDLQAWWQDKSILTNRQRLFEFYLEVLLANTRDPIVIMVDELQVTEGLTFAAQLVESITAVNQARPTEPELSRLGFVLSGECDAATLVPDPELSPFTMMRGVRLSNFTREDLKAYAAELNLDAARATLALDRIHHWTAGQPYLVQKLCRMLSRSEPDDDVKRAVDRLVRQQFGARASLRNEPHLAHIHRRIVADRKQLEACLNTYGRMRKGISVVFEPESRAQRLLIAVGLVRPNRSGNLAISSPLLRLAFPARWANENLPLRWRGPAAALAALLLLCAVPFWYTQLLPRPFTRILTTPTTDMSVAADAYRDLHSFPGHRDTAERLFSGYLRLRGSTATSAGEISQIAELGTELAEAGGLSAELVAEFWDRRVRERLRREERDGALIAALESLIEPSLARRRIAGSLIGQDYPLLIGGAPLGDAQAIAYDPFNQVLTATRGADVRQWLVQAGRIEDRPSWSATALEVTPLLRRVIAEGSGTVSSLALTVVLDHSRLDDLRARLVAPSGRAAELSLSAARPSGANEIAIPPEALRVLSGESLAGTWTLSLRDESMDVSGQLLSWNMQINGRRIPDEFDEPLPIPEPVERASDNVWLSADGRYAIARAQQSDSARLWNLAYASPTRTLAIPASEQVLGVSTGGERVVTLDGSIVHVWRSASGDRERTVDVGAAQAVTWLAGERVLVRRNVDAGAVFEVHDLASRRRTASVRIAGDAALATTDPLGEILAVADYDRAVRLWRLDGGELVSQFDLPVQPTAIYLAPDGRTLAARYADRGVSVWRADRPESALLTRLGSGQWGVAFSAAGDRLIAGSERVGYQIYRSDDGRAIGPPLDAGGLESAADLLRFSDDGNVVVTGGTGSRVRFWRYPTAASALTPRNPETAARGRWWWRDTEDLVARLSPEGGRVAVGDADGHVHIFGKADPPSDSGRDLGYLGHRRGVVSLAFSDDAALTASVGLEGSLRVWDADTGLPRDYVGALGTASVDALRFSPSGRFLAALLGSRFWLLSVGDGAVVADLDLGEVHADFDFAADESIFLAASGGVVRRLRTDRLGNWALENVFKAPRALTRLRAGRQREILVLVDDQNVSSVYDLATANLADRVVALPDSVSEIVFFGNESQVLLRTSQWVHRVAVSESGVYWQDAARAPQLLSGSGLAVDVSSGDRTRGRTAPRLLMLTRDAGFAEVAELSFPAGRSAPVPGSREELLEQWRQRLGATTRPRLTP